MAEPPLAGVQFVGAGLALMEGETRIGLGAEGPGRTGNEGAPVWKVRPMGRARADASESRRPIGEGREGGVGCWVLVGLLGASPFCADRVV